jgi:hypothetical protein
MRRILFAALAGTSLFAATTAFADDSKPVSPTPATATSDADKPICKPVTHEGQVVGQTCHTQKDWDRMEFQSQQMLRQYQQQSLYNTPH